VRAAPTTGGHADARCGFVSPVRRPAGAGESGKSTIFKQMRILYGKGYSDEDRRGFKPVIFSNTLLSMKTLISQAEEMSLAVEATVRGADFRALAPAPLAPIPPLARAGRRRTRSWCPACRTPRPSTSASRRASTSCGRTRASSAPSTTAPGFS